MADVTVNGAGGRDPETHGASLPRLDPEAVLAAAPDLQALDRHLGDSRGKRPIRGTVRGRGPVTVSLVGGCHADEPVGPEMLRRLATHLAGLPADAPVLEAARWCIVPHVNPDGEAANAGWSEEIRSAVDHRGAPARVFDLPAYLDGAVRELPGDDLEWSFPMDGEDRDTRPEALAVADFLREEGPFHLHASLHGMAFAAGPWFLLEKAWAEATEGMREELRRKVEAMGYVLHDVDRKGEKGFERIAEGFSTRPDSRAMARFFIDRGDASTASLFRPSSMEFVRSLGGDPLTLVSEMPLFLIPRTASEAADAPPLPVDPEGRQGFTEWTRNLRASQGDDAFRAACRRFGIRPMPLDDQMRLQIAFINEGLKAALTGAAEEE